MGARHYENVRHLLSLMGSSGVAKSSRQPSGQSRLHPRPVLICCRVVHSPPCSHARRPALRVVRRCAECCPIRSASNPLAPSSKTGRVPSALAPVYRAKSGAPVPQARCPAPSQWLGCSRRWLSINLSGRGPSRRSTIGTMGRPAVELSPSRALPSFAP